MRLSSSTGPVFDEGTPGASVRSNVRYQAGLAHAAMRHLNFLYGELDTVYGKHPWNRGER